MLVVVQTILKVQETGVTKTSIFCKKLNQYT